MNDSTTNLMFSSKSDEWETPSEIFNDLNDVYKFTLDPCATRENAKCEKYYTKEDDGLSKDWGGNTVFVNPPYGRSIGKWVKKCYEENIKNGITVVMLIPSRTDTSWFHDYILNKSEIIFIRGRLKFINKTLPSYKENGDFKTSPAPFPSMVVVFKSEKINKLYYYDR